MEEEWWYALPQSGWHLIEVLLPPSMIEGALLLHVDQTIMGHLMWSGLEITESSSEIIRC